MHMSTTATTTLDFVFFAAAAAAAALHFSHSPQSRAEKKCENFYKYLGIHNFCHHCCCCCWLYQVTFGCCSALLSFACRVVVFVVVVVAVFPVIIFCVARHGVAATKLALIGCLFAANFVVCAAAGSYRSFAGCRPVCWPLVACTEHSWLAVSALFVALI